MDKNKKVRVTLIKSLIGTKNKHRLTVRSLGLKKINQTVSLYDNSAIRGMINKVFYLLKVEE